MSQVQFEQTVQAERSQLYDEFISYLYLNYPIGNGDMLLELEEDTGVQIRFLEDKGLPLDTVF